LRPSSGTKETRKNLTPNTMESQYRFRVPGGLGNQLFSYFCANYVANTLCTKVSLDLRSVDQNHFQNGIALTSLEFPEDCVSISEARGSSFILTPLQNQFKVKIASRLDLLRVKTFEPGQDSKVHVDEYINSLSNYFLKLRMISGYFADFAFYDSLPDKYRALSLKEPTNDFKMLSKSFNNHRSIAVHHRLGDFLELGQTVGILSKEYYSDALDQAILGDFEKVVVFSNDTEKSKFLFNTWGLRNPKFTWLGPEDLIDPAETMLLMSKANAIVCSNSTFSFWAARISSEKVAKMYYPSSFRRDDFSRVHNLPESWVPVQSNWIDYRDSF
jgi:hypothetical protein